MFASLPALSCEESTGLEMLDGGDIWAALCCCLPEQLCVGRGIAEEEERAGVGVQSVSLP